MVFLERDFSNYLCKSVHFVGRFGDAGPMIDKILELLEDGGWRDLKEITNESKLPESKAKMILSFLMEYDFIRLDTRQRRAKLTPPMLKFLSTIKRIERRNRQRFK